MAGGKSKYFFSASSAALREPWSGFKSKKKGCAQSRRGRREENAWELRMVMRRFCRPGKTWLIYWHECQ